MGTGTDFRRCASTSRQQSAAVPVLTLLFVWVACHTAAAAGGARLPSLFRGVVVADSPVGVRVVSVEEGSQAAQADLRAEDIIVRINGEEVETIEAFATLSAALKGRLASTAVVLLRNGKPLELQLHLYSYPVFREWGIEFVPEHDLRYAVPAVGLEYWRRLGRGFEEARQPAGALDAYLNALHHVSTDLPTALKVVELLSQQGQEELNAGRLSDAVRQLRHALTMMQKLFDYPLTDAQLGSIKSQLQGIVAALREAETAR